ncbi:hypothetical protein PR202_ga08664 [Eleusine coracana subsp. coracana]|uniref:Uncharacterized protein n=1 Tax=Eleusine coracana subsp. coracana TaxID=191504 RepID=A0AAV5C1X5_ELECO|nr:hypothetical protein PR202_ga08664 [Eleusine coracana subsp. coracana]
MECLELDSSQFSLNTDAISNSLDIHLQFDSFSGAKAVPDDSSSSPSASVPDPPPLPGTSYGGQRNSRTGRCLRKGKAYRRVAEEVLDSWDKLFSEGYQADLRVLTDDDSEILTHSCVLGVKSPVLRTMLEESKLKNGFRCIRISGVPPEATHMFVRFLYSSRYDITCHFFTSHAYLFNKPLHSVTENKMVQIDFEQEQMKKHVLHLLVLSHVFAVPSLKTVCIDELERTFLAPDNVVDMLQLARLCDAPRLSLICTRMIIGDFRNISLTDGWKVMRQTNPSLEQELFEVLVEADTKRQERAKRMEEKKVYLQLYEAMEALVHICREGCKTIGPRDQALKGSRAAVCKFPACKGIELLVRHFSVCRVRVPGGCANCKRMWQLLELHSRICFTPDTCKVPLCR